MLTQKIKLQAILDSAGVHLPVTSLLFAAGTLLLGRIP